MKQEHHRSEARGHRLGIGAWSLAYSLNPRIQTFLSTECVSGSVLGNTKMTVPSEAFKDLRV